MTNVFPDKGQEKRLWRKKVCVARVPAYFPLPVGCSFLSARKSVC